jgi:hypothetical protein
VYLRVTLHQIYSQHISTSKRRKEMVSSAPKEARSVWASPGAEALARAARARGLGFTILTRTKMKMQRLYRLR